MRAILTSTSQRVTDYYTLVGHIEFVYLNGRYGPRLFIQIITQYDSLPIAKIYNTYIQNINTWNNYLI